MSDLPTAVFILGMHRSGTSMLAEALHSCGLKTAEQLIPADPAVNPRGFWEDANLVAINENLFAALNSSWYDVNPLPEKWWQSNTLDDLRSRAATHITSTYPNTEQLLIKDPRLSRLAPFWLPLFVDQGFNIRIVVVTRNPNEVAKSLTARDSLPESYSYLLWLRYMQDLQALTAEHSSVFIDYTDILQDPQTALTTLLDELALSELAVPDLSRIADPSLRHHTSESANIQPGIAKQAEDLYRQLRNQISLAGLDVEIPDFSAAAQIVGDLVHNLLANAGQSVEIGELHSNAQSIVAERDQQLQAVQQQLGATGKLYEEAVRAITDKDQSLAELATEAEQARTVISERERQLAETQAELGKTAALYETAVTSIEDKDASISELVASNNAKDTSMSELVAEVEQARGVIAERELQISELYQRLEASFLGRLALRAVKRKSSD